jgi:hypothetical protein
VFVERLNFCHTIELAGRLEQHPVTIPVEELLLQKVQIVEMTTTDLIDAGVLLATHDVASGQDAADGEAVDATHIARILARDWGFHHTATRNLERVRQSVAGAAAIDVGAEGAARVEQGVQRLLDAIDAEGKSLAWRMRDKVGERKQWWQDVDDREATY